MRKNELEFPNVELVSNLAGRVIPVQNTVLRSNYGASFNRPDNPSRQSTDRRGWPRKNGDRMAVNNLSREELPIKRRQRYYKLQRAIRR